MNHLPASPVETRLRELAAKRVLVLDGAMGTMIQALRLDKPASAARALTPGIASCAAITICSISRVRRPFTICI